MSESESRTEEILAQEITRLRKQQLSKRRKNKIKKRKTISQLKEVVNDARCSFNDTPPFLSSRVDNNYRWVIGWQGGKRDENGVKSLQTFNRINGNI